MHPCGYLSSTELPYVTGPLTIEPSWWASYGPALIAVLFIVGVILAFDAWAQFTGKSLTLSSMIRRGPAWLKGLVIGTLAWLGIHLLVQK